MHLMSRATRASQWRMKAVCWSEKVGKSAKCVVVGIVDWNGSREPGTFRKRVSTSRAEYVPGICSHCPSYMSTPVVSSCLDAGLRTGGREASPGGWSPVKS